MEVVTKSDNKLTSGRSLKSQAQNSRRCSQPEIKSDQKVEIKKVTPLSISQSIFDPTIHKPPRIDHFGYNKETHKGRELLNRNAKNILTESTQVPSWWMSKNIRDTKFMSGTMKDFKELGSTTPRVGTQSDSKKELEARSRRFASVSSIPLGFHGLPEKQTKTKLIEYRKKENIPDLTYDLDGDGFVGGRDYVIARRFDEGQKNYLTKEEREKAFQAVADGYEERFVWNVEASGNQRPYRILQKRGVIVDADDYQGLTQTYPEHPMTEVNPKIKTFTELAEFRKQTEKADIRVKKEGRDSKVSDLQKEYKDYYQPQEYVQNPKFTATWQKDERDHLMAREKAGLNPTAIDINPEKLVDPSITWVNKPIHNCKSVLVDARKIGGLKDQQKFEKNFETHVDGQGRIENRENCILRLSFKGLDTVTMNKQVLKEKRTKEMIEDMTKKFGAQVLGVHGAELPKFAGHKTDQFYWTMQKSYNKSPRCQSLNLLKQQTKYWANNDEMKLADTTGELAPIDPFKTVHQPQKSKFNIADKINGINHWKPTGKCGDPELKNGWMPLLKWSAKEKNFKCQGPDRSFRTFEKIVDHAQTADKVEAERLVKVEETIIKQAPRALQMDLAQKIANDKAIEASKTIGANSKMKAGDNQMQKKFEKQNTQGGAQNLDATAKTMKDQKDGAGLDNKNATNSSLQTSMQGTGAPLALIQMQSQNANLLQTQNIMSSMYMQTGKGSLMQRMASPDAKKMGQTQTMTNTMQSTMAGTQGLQKNMGSTSSSAKFNLTKGSGSGASPFRETVARGMVTGVGLLGAPK